MRAYEPIPRHIEKLATWTLDAAYEVHTLLGPGLLERAYVRAMEHELGLRDVPVEREVETSLTYKGEPLGACYRIDLLVGGKLVVEVKAVEELHPVHRAQVLSYLKARKARLGLLLNFGEKHMRDGIRRVAL